MRKSRYSFLFLIVFFFCCYFSHGEPFQIYLEPQGKAIVNHPLEIKVYILDEHGNIDKSYQGEKKVKFKVKREESSLPIEGLPSFLSFRKGVSSFSFKIEQEEKIILEMEIESLRSYSPLGLNFISKDISPPQIISVRVEKRNILFLKFSEPLDEESATEESNYTIVTNRGERHPTKIEYHNDYVILFLSPELEDDEEGYVEVRNIKDKAENEMLSPTRSPTFQGCGC